jgi:HJR/Mrr/RecB family endonuclease
MSSYNSNELTAFRVGHSYSNDQIRFSLQVENLGGIRPALDGQGNVRHVAILTAASDSGKLFSDNPYMDRIEGDILVYTGQGRIGDQKLDRRNKRLVEQYATPVPFLGFINEGKQTYRFLGLLELLRHYQERQVDRSCGLRRVFVFEFRIHHSPGEVPIAYARKLMAEILAQSRASGETTVAAETDATTEENDLSIQSATLLETIRSTMMQLSPSGFEHFLQSLMLKSGFKDVAVVGKSGDGGIDIDAVVDPSNAFFGGMHIQVQAKRWRHAVGNGEINHFRGAISPRARGIFVTTSLFTTAAVREAVHPNKPTISLIDGLRLAGVVDALKVEVA